MSFKMTIATTKTPNKEGAKSAGEPTERVEHVDEVQQPPVFGIKSYIDQFYDWKSPTLFEETEGW